MSPWIWPVVAFAAVLVWAAARRRMFVLAACLVAYAALAAWFATADAPAARFLAPLAVLVTGYGLTAPFYTSPSPRLEAWLMRYDDALQIDARVGAAPGWLKALVELTYFGCYPFMVIAAFPAFSTSPEAFGWHWTLVLSAELACYVTLPWLQARPPRGLRKNKPGIIFRRINERFLDRLSVHATTIPSGHVAGPVAASLSAWMIAPEWGPWLLAGALAITAATVIGRYHYAADALFGLASGALPPAIRAFWL